MSHFDSYEEEKKAQEALDDLKQLIHHALNNHEFMVEEISIWGVPLLADKRSNVILLKFLRARDYDVKEAFTMIKNTIRWRKDFGVDDLVQEDLDTDLQKAVFMHGFDREGRPVWYNIYREFQNEELYQKTFTSNDKHQRFLRWRVQQLEKCIRKHFDFNSSYGISTIIEVSDLKHSPKQEELTRAIDEILNLFQENYPEIVAKHVFINVPWWHRASNWMISPFLSKTTKSKFVSVGTSKSVETLFKYIAPDQVPVMYKEEGYNKK